MKINKKELISFLVEAKKATYDSGNLDKKIKNPDFSTTLIYEKGKYKYHDNYFGGEPFGGREVIFYQDKPIYIMLYYGFVENNFKNYIGELYKFLQLALLLVTFEMPYRGPVNYKQGLFEYKNFVQGDLKKFFGEEKIFYKNKFVYKCNYMGGFIDQ